MMVQHFHPKGKFEDRDAEIAFTFNEKRDMESMTVSAHYTTGEILKKPD